MNYLTRCEADGTRTGVGRSFMSMASVGTRLQAVDWL